MTATSSDDAMVTSPMDCEEADPQETDDNSFKDIDDLLLEALNESDEDSLLRIVQEGEDQEVPLLAPGSSPPIHHRIFTRYNVIPVIRADKQLSDDLEQLLHKLSLS